MAENSKIEWTSATWNPITGCLVKSPGCIHCYAMREAGTGRTKNHPSRVGLTRLVNGQHVWTGEVRFNQAWLYQPLKWKAPKDIFVVAHGDLAYEAVPDAWIAEVFNVMAKCPQHRFQMLTKRPDRLARLLGGPKPHDLWSPKLWHLSTLPNVWIGTSVERQQEADERGDHLASIARLGWNTWVSYEPALGPVDWRGWEFIRWMVSGGESALKARPSHPEWHRETRDWCATHEIPYFFKQWGSWREFDHGSRDYEVDAGAEFAESVLACAVKPGWITRDGQFFARQDDLPDGIPCRLMERLGKKHAGATLDGREHKEMPR